MVEREARSTGAPGASGAGTGNGAGAASGARPRRPSKPYWRTGFDAVEGSVAPWLEQFVRSEWFAITVDTVNRLEGRLAREIERAQRRFWHFWGLPSSGDVRNLAERVAHVDRRVRDLSDTLDDAR